MIAWRLLRAISDDPGYGPSVYAARLCATATATQRACDRLQELRYITRTPVPDRANHVALQITDSGRKALEVAG
jgi:DNA-binding MarR family transcriptional regulator